MLGIVAFRNLIELSGSEFDFDTGGFVLPKSFGWFWFRGHKTINFLWTISYVRSLDLDYLSNSADTTLS